MRRTQSTSWVISIASGFVVLWYAAAFLESEWKTGVGQYQGELKVMHVGLTNVKMKPADGPGADISKSLRDLCVAEQYENSRQRQLRISNVPGGETPAAVWCALDDTGGAVLKFLLAAWIPALMVFAWASARAVQDKFADVEATVEKMAAMGVTDQVLDTAVCALWMLYWFIILIAMTLYASRAPADFGVGPANFGQSFELMRACVLVTSALGAALLARALKLWDAGTVEEFFMDLKEAPPLRLACFLMLLLQCVLYCVVSLAQIQFAPVICILGLWSLSFDPGENPQMEMALLWAYALATIVSIPMDVINLVSQSWGGLNIIWLAAYTALAAILLLKFVILGCLVFMNAKFNFLLKFKGEGGGDAKKAPAQKDDSDSDYEA